MKATDKASSYCCSSFTFVIARRTILKVMAVGVKIFIKISKASVILSSVSSSLIFKISIKSELHYSKLHYSAIQANPTTMNSVLQKCFQLSPFEHDHSANILLHTTLPALCKTSTTAPFKPTRQQRIVP